MPWPQVGGGGDMHLRVSEEELFARMCAWEDENYIMCCASKDGSDTVNTDGIIDGHAYTILACIQSAGGTSFDMIRVRNPHGKGEITTGRWDDDGPGWDEYPQVRQACNPELGVENGIFWLERDEFFTYFKTVYLCACDMHEFVGEAL